MVGGFVGYRPPGLRLPTNDPADKSPGGGSLVLQTSPGEAPALTQALPPGVAPLTAALYLDVQPATVKAAMEPLVKKLDVPWLELYWDQTAFSPSSKDDLIKRYLERFMLGQVAVFVLGGTELGQAALTGPTGPARFTLRLLDGAANDLSPVLHLRTMPIWGGSHWTGHPLIAAVSNVTVPVNLWVAFEVWDRQAAFQSLPAEYQRLPAGVEIDLVDYDAAGPNDVRATVKTDQVGVAHFAFPSMDDLAHDNDLFFLAHTKGYHVAGHDLPDEWSTKGWTATDGTSGYHPSFAGSQLGDQTHPVVFRIGVDVHVKVRYADLHRRTQYHPKPSTGPPLDAPKGTKVLLRAHHAQGPQGQDYDDDVLNLTLDGNGEAHASTFNLEGGEDLYWLTRFEIEDTSIGLALAQVKYESPWETWYGGEGQRYPENQRTSLGTQLNPELLKTDREGRAASLFVMKSLREFSIFFNELTGGDWTGLELVYDTYVIKLPFSWPAGRLHFNPPYWLDRWTVFHETGHQLMWAKVTSLSSTWVGYTELNPLGDLYMTHDIPLRSTGIGALVEGWAEFVEQLFDSGGKVGAPPWPFKELFKPKFPLDYELISPPISLGPNPPPSGGTLAPAKTGEIVEGAFANGLWQVVVDVVDTSGNARRQVPFTTDGNIKAIPQLGWISDHDTKVRFRSMIWEPLKALSSHPNPTTTAYLSEMKRLNSGDWHRLLDALQVWDLARSRPIFTAIAPATGPAGTNITITGGEFAATTTTVTIGGIPATNNLRVISHERLTVDTPANAPGARDVVVTTLGGSVTAPLAFVYT
jgi:hypothetical protein